MKKLEEALSLVTELHSYSIINKDKYYTDKLLQIIINLSTIDEELSTNNSLNNNQNEIDKVKRKVPKWLKKTHQSNYKILKAYMELSNNNEIAIPVNELEKHSEVEPKTFLGHYNAMKTISKKNHAKVFEESFKEVRLWKPVAGFIEELFRGEEMNSKENKNSSYLFNGKIYQKNNKSGSSIGNLIFDIFKKYLAEHPNKTYAELQTIFNKLHKEFSGDRNKKKVLLNRDDFYQWFNNENNNDSKKDERYFGYGKYGTPINYNNEELYFTTQWGNKTGKYGNINTFLDFAIDELKYEIKKL